MFFQINDLHEVYVFFDAGGGEHLIVDSVLVGVFVTEYSLRLRAKTNIS